MNSLMYAQAFSSGIVGTVLSPDLSTYQLREGRNWPQGRRGPATRARHDPSAPHKSIADARQVRAGCRAGVALTSRPRSWLRAQRTVRISWSRPGARAKWSLT